MSFYRQINLVNIICQILHEIEQENVCSMFKMTPIDLYAMV